MYTGIVQGAFEAVEVHRKSDFMSFAVQFPPELLEDLGPGTSVNIDGVCQTVVKVDGHKVWFDAMIETLRRVPVQIELLNEVSAYLYRCDLIKFAKVIADAEEVDQVLAKARDIVQVSTPRGEDYRPAHEEPAEGDRRDRGAATGPAP